MPQTINKQSRVRMHFSLRLEDGFEVDATEGDELLEFSMGDGSLHPGLEQLLLGLKAGDKQHFSVAPEQAFGERDPQAIQSMPRSAFGDIALEEGQVIGFDTPAGDELPGAILSIGEEMVEVDFNHPLAGHSLGFEVEIVSLEEGA